MADWSPPRTAFLRQKSGAWEPSAGASIARNHGATVRTEALTSTCLRRSCAPGRTGLETFCATADLNRSLPGMHQRKSAATEADGVDHPCPVVADTVDATPVPIDAPERPGVRLTPDLGISESEDALRRVVDIHGIRLAACPAHGIEGGRPKTDDDDRIHDLDLRNRVLECRLLEKTGSGIRVLMLPGLMKGKMFVA